MLLFYYIVSGLGILLFLVQMAVMAWVRFINISITAAIVTTCIIIPVLLIFIGFSVIFYRRLISHQYQEKARELEQLQNCFDELEGGLREGVGHESMISTDKYISTREL